MAANEICFIDEELKSTLRSFRFRKETSSKAIIMKIDRKTQRVVVEDILEDITTEELRDELPEHQPRFAVYSFRMQHSDDDNRISYPMCLLYSTPRGCQIEQSIMYAGTKLSLVREAELTKVFEIRDLEEFDDEWLMQKLKK